MNLANLMNKNILITIAARGGSKGVKNKNIRLLHGRPLIAITIAQAQKWGRADSIVVSTDSEAIANVARECGAEVPFMRPEHLATDVAAKIPALQHALAEMERIKQKKFDIVVDLDPTSPIREMRDLDAILSLFLSEPCKSAFSVTAAHKNPYFNMIELNDQGYAHTCKALPAGVTRRQDAPQVYSMNASMYVYDRAYLLDPKTTSAISDQSRVYVMSDLSSVDIDREIDFKFVEFLIKESMWSLD